MKASDAIASLQTEDIEQFDALLGSFLNDTQARSVVLVDRAGRLLTSVGDTAGFDRITFASLAAADFAASDQLALLLGETEFSSLYHQGVEQSMYLADIAGWAIVAALFDRRTTLGLVRVRMRGILPRFETVFSELAARRSAVPEVLMEAGWVTEAEDEVDRLFKDQD